MVTVRMLAFDVETWEVRIIDDGYYLFYYYKLPLHGLITCSAIKIQAVTLQRTCTYQKLLKLKSSVGLWFIGKTYG